ncbi:hypothetical protein OEZ86_004101 [Tetradesmus obliquus]|nr:hypothetical protein OEZ86_004101 [Tetradesmus obliquus]
MNSNITLYMLHLLLLLALAAPFNSSSSTLSTNGAGSPELCSQVHRACNRCVYARKTRDSSAATTLVCLGCTGGYRLKKAWTPADTPTCECAAGRFWSPSAQDCLFCPKGQYCSGGGNSMGCKQCPPGLTTVQAASTAYSQCVAPPGYCMGNSAAKKCPRGTYTDSFNTLSFCIACKAGLTTPDEASTSIGACKLATRGYHLTVTQSNRTAAQQTGNLDSSAGGNSSTNSSTGLQSLKDPFVATIAAALCPPNSYQDGETTQQQCTSCPHGLRTEQAGADGVALCLAPPGMQLLPGDGSISDCPVGSYKEGWNLNPCISCGDGLLTESDGAVSADACYVPPGFGIVRVEGSGAVSAVMCVQGMFGRSAPNYDTRSTRCMPCPGNTATADVITGIPASSGYTDISDCQPLPGKGFFPDGVVQPCPVGLWSAGLQQRTCKPCPAAHTTLSEGSTSPKDCVVQPGWAMAGNGLPQPCAKGFYGPGGSAGDADGACIECPAGWTTAESAEDSASDCRVCLPGYGGPACAHCPPTPTKPCP